MKIISLTLNSQFHKLYRRGKSSVSPTMVVYAIKNREGFNRLGITAGKKVGGAVERNRAKRRIRELYRLMAENLKCGYDICIVARGYTPNAPYKKLYSDFVKVMKAVEVWQDESTADMVD